MSQLRSWFRVPSRNNTLAHNTWRMYQDLLWVGLMSAAITYINVYALRLGASDELIGLHTSIPALIMLLVRIPAARLMERTPDRQRLIVWLLYGGRSLYLLIFLLPWLSKLPLLREIPPATLLVGVVLLMAVPSAFTQAGWDSFFADVIPDAQRAKVVSVRSAMSNILTLTAIPLFGMWLDWAAFPWNYQVVFLLAFVGAMLSTWHVQQIKLPATAVRPNKAAKALTFSEIKRILGENQAFSALTLGTFVYMLAINIAGPLFTIYYVDYLGASDSWIGWQAALASLVSIVAYRLWPGVIEKYGARKVLIYASPLMMLFPLLTGLATTLWPHMFIVMWPRFIGAGVMIARYSLLLRACPEARRPTYIAIYAIASNIAAFVAPMAGVALSDAIGINNVFFVAAAFRLAAGVLYWRLPKAVSETVAS